MLCEYILMLACGLSAVLILQYDLATPGLAIWTLIYAILGYLVEKEVSQKVPFTENPNESPQTK